jgi:hypothetical protein
VLNRRQAVVGYLTFRVARRLARREARRRLGRLLPGGDRDPQGGLMFKKSGPRAAATDRASAVADRATAVLETVRPIVTKAVNDPELHEALRQAFTTGRQVQDEISGKPPAKAAKKLARDKKLQKRVESSAQDLRAAVQGVIDAAPQRRPSRIKKMIGRIGLLAAAAGVVALVLRRLRGGGDAV